MSDRLICEFSVPGRAVPERKRQVPPRGAFRGARVDTEDAKAYKALVKLAAAQAMGGSPPADGPLRLEWREHRRRASGYRKRDIYPTKRPDCTNLQKLLEDAMTGVVWQDDSQVCVQLGAKVFDDGPGPRVRVEVRALEADTP